MSAGDTILHRIWTPPKFHLAGPPGAEHHILHTGLYQLSNRITVIQVIAYDHPKSDAERGIKYPNADIQWLSPGLYLVCVTPRQVIFVVLR